MRERSEFENTQQSILEDKIRRMDHEIKMEEIKYMMTVKNSLYLKDAVLRSRMRNDNLHMGVNRT